MSRSESLAPVGPNAAAGATYDARIAPPAYLLEFSGGGGGHRVLDSARSPPRKAGRVPDGPVWRALELAEYNPDTGQITLDGVTFHVEFPPTHDVVKP